MMAARNGNEHGCSNETTHTLKVIYKGSSSENEMATSVEVLSLVQGENWVCWDHDANGRHTRVYLRSNPDQPFEISSASTQTSPFVCLDIDGSVATIKDMRYDSDISTPSDCWVLQIQSPTRRKPTKLPRRRMHVLHLDDLFCLYPGDSRIDDAPTDVTVQYTCQILGPDPNAMVGDEFPFAIADQPMVNLADDVVATQSTSLFPSPVREHNTDDANDSDTASESDFTHTQTIAPISTAPGSAWCDSGANASSALCDGLLTQPSPSTPDLPTPALAHTHHAALNPNNDEMSDDNVTVDPVQDATQAYEWKTQADDGYNSPVQLATVDLNGASLHVRNDAHSPSLSTPIDKLHPPTESAMASPDLLASPAAQSADTEQPAPVPHENGTTALETEPVSPTFPADQCNEPDVEAPSNTLESSTTREQREEGTPPVEVFHSAKSQLVDEAHVQRVGAVNESRPAHNEPFVAPSHRQDRQSTNGAATLQSVSPCSNQEPAAASTDEATFFTQEAAIATGTEPVEDETTAPAGGVIELLNVKDPNAMRDERVVDFTEHAAHQEAADTLQVFASDSMQAPETLDKQGDDEPPRSDRYAASGAIETPIGVDQAEAALSDQVVDEIGQNCSLQHETSREDTPLKDGLNASTHKGERAAKRDDEDDATEDPASSNENVARSIWNESFKAQPIVEQPTESMEPPKTVRQRKRKDSSTQDSVTTTSQSNSRRSRKHKDAEEPATESSTTDAPIPDANVARNEVDATQDLINQTVPTVDQDDDLKESLPSAKSKAAKTVIQQPVDAGPLGTKRSRNRNTIATQESLPDATVPKPESKPTRKRKGATEAVESVLTNAALQTPDTTASKRNTRATATKAVPRSTLGRSRRTSDGTAGDPPIRIITTGVDLDKKQEKMVTAIGGTLLRDTAQAHTATHVIASDGTTEVRRTVKLMIALCRTTNIVTLDWLIQSAAQGRPLPPSDFATDAPSRGKPELSMSRTLQNVQRNVRHGVHILDTWHVLVCPGVAGKRAPPPLDFQLVVEAAGAVWLPSLKAITTSLDCTRVLVITGDPETKSHVKGVVGEALAKGATKRTTTWLFDAMMKQEVDLPASASDLTPDRTMV